MDPSDLTCQCFAKLGASLTQKAHRSLASAIGLAGSIHECDETFVSFGLRRSNSALALLTDRFHLDFATTDAEIWQYSETKDEDEWLDDARRRGWRDPVLEDDLLLRDSGLLSDATDDHVTRIGAEGEPDSGTLESVSGEDTPEVFRLALNAAHADGRSIIETFDFMPSFLALPTTAPIFERAKLSASAVMRELARYRTLEPFSERQQFAIFVEKNRLCLRSFGVLDGIKYAERAVEPQDLIVQLSETAPFLDRGLVDDFEVLINRPQVSERNIHDFFNAHPQFIQGDRYAALHSELVLRRGDEGDLIPDFFAELTNRRYVDLIDLKKPNESLIVGSKNRRGFSAAVHSAINQLREYRSFFDSRRRRDEFYQLYGLRAWKPQIAVIIGRDPVGDDYEELVSARRSVVDADVITYDDVLARARCRSITVGAMPKG